MERDAANLREYARFIVILGGTQSSPRIVRVIDNEEQKEKGPYAKVIAILGPVVYNGALFKESILLEISYSRARPYAQTEKQREGVKVQRGKSLHVIGPRWSLKQRHSLRKLSKEEFILVFPLIEAAMAAVVQELRSGWKKSDKWNLRKHGLSIEEVPKGIFFTVDRSDVLMHHCLVLEDARYRIERYIGKHARWIYGLLRDYGRPSGYTEARIKGFKNAKVLAELLARDHYSIFYRSVFRGYFASLLDKRYTHLLDVFDLVTKVFRIDMSPNGFEGDALRFSDIIPAFKKLTCYRMPDRDQPKNHGKGSTVFEVFPK